jgi:hypothetical protein
MFSAIALMNDLVTFDRILWSYYLSGYLEQVHQAKHQKAVIFVLNLKPRHYHKFYLFLTIFFNFTAILPYPT